VPIPAMDCAKCGTPVLTKALVDKAASVFDVYGADSWYERPVEEFIPDGMTCAACGHTGFEREGNILDVWFDSGSSHEAVLPFREDHHWPADLYLEGSDQHRGWFHSSLLVGVGTRGRAPFNQVLTHGFVMDENGRKMSKSLGNTTAPQDVIKQSGAEILRLWVTMVDYRYDINLGKEVLSRTVESYRKFRNVIRVLVANLYDFDPKDDSVPKAKMLEIDRYVLAKYADAAEKMIKAYEDYDYPAIFQIANQLITVDLSAFYVDVTKDRMYTYGAKSEGRRSGQTAMFTVVDGLARLLAPVLSVTMDELWRMLPGPREESVHMALFPRDLDEWQDAALVERFSALAAYRDAVNLQLEAKRKDKVITANLSAKVRVTADGDDAKWLSEQRDFLPTLFGVSEVELAPGPFTVSVEPASGTKCERCWRYVPEVSAEPDRSGLCPRCVEALAEPVSL
jgi:isoleucyl-tRNA synthetase